MKKVILVSFLAFTACGTAVRGSVQESVSEGAWPDQPIIASNPVPSHRIVLKDNYVRVKNNRGKYQTVNLLDEKVFSSSNTTYEIRSTFDLNGKIIRVPDNIYLDFKGGRIVNGLVSGRILNEEVDITDFGIVGDGKTDNTFALHNLLSCLKGEHTLRIIFPFLVVYQMEQNILF